jgi:predicted dehydrogenase
MRFAIVGCGDISGRYAQRIAETDGLELAGATDAAPGRGDALVAAAGGTSYPTLEALLADDGVDAVVNLTPALAHAAVTRSALEAGTHVHTEKPLALTHDEARGLVELADRRGLTLGCAPATLLGEAQQTAWKLVREGAIGTPRVAYAEANWGRVESWHPSPATLHSVGAIVDVGVYPLTMLTAMFGPARRVQAYGATLKPDRATRDGTPFRIHTPDFVVAVLELAGGVVVRLTASFYVEPGRQLGIELHGDDAMLHLASWSEFDSRLELGTSGESYEPVELVREPYRGIDWGRALVELRDAVAERREPRTSARHAAHVVEALEAIDRSRRAGGASVDVISDFDAPAPMEWAR